MMLTWHISIYSIPKTDSSKSVAQQERHSHAQGSVGAPLVLKARCANAQGMPHVPATGASIELLFAMGFLDWECRFWVEMLVGWFYWSVIGWLPSGKLGESNIAKAEPPIGRGSSAARWNYQSVRQIT